MPKQIAAIRTNFLYRVEDKTGELAPEVELIIVHSDGKGYELSKKGGGVTSYNRIHESRFMLSPDALTQMLGELQPVASFLQQHKQNAVSLNRVVKMLRETGAADDEPTGGAAT